MTTNETRLFCIFIFLCAFLVMAFYFSSRFFHLSQSLNSISFYNKSLSMQQVTDINMAALKKQLENMKEKVATTKHDVKTSQYITDSLSEIRSSLAKEHIRPDRYTITGKPPLQTVEFTLRTTPVLFLTFLKSYAQDKANVPFSYLSMKFIPNEDVYEIVFRVQYEK